LSQAFRFRQAEKRKNQKAQEVSRVSRGQGIGNTNLVGVKGFFDEEY
jgi:hypothetical protein